MMYATERFDLQITGFSDASSLPPDLHGCFHAESGTLKLNASQVKKNFKVVAPWLSQFSSNQPVLLNERPVSDLWLASLFRELIKKEEVLQYEAKNPDALEHWGTSLLTSVSRYLPESYMQMGERLHWFQVGTFSEPGVWLVDKSQIRAILWQECEDKFLFLCPSFHFGRTEQIISRLPDIIDARKDGNWRVLEQTVAEGTRIRKKAIGVIHKVSLQQQRIEKAEGGATAAVQRKRFIPDTTFEEIGGIDSILNTIREVIELPLKRPEVFTHLGIKPHRGVLLYGPPGCGKTMIAKAIANEIQAHFIPVKGPELLEKYYGASEDNLRKLFEEAREFQPAVIFFDEMDAIAGRRTGLDVLRMDDRLVNQLLALMDGIEAYGNVCVIGATNRPELIDAALTRPGRFDYLLEVPLPDLTGVQQILQIATKKMPLEANVNQKEIAEKLQGRSGAEITFTAREAAYNCIRRAMKTAGNTLQWSALEPSSMRVSAEDFEKALTKLKS